MAKNDVAVRWRQGYGTVKLNVKRTALVGLAFFTINAVWQLYNTEIPIMLDTMIEKAITALFGAEFLAKFPKNTIINAMMSVDNIMALVLLPMFGVLSDRTHTRLGKRTPYIIAGVVGTAIMLPLVAAFYAIGSIVGVFITLVFVLLAMSIYRSPAVALMPDITPKPLRSEGNAIINIMGAAGNVVIVCATLVIGKLLIGGTKYYIALFIFTSVVIVAALAIFLVTVRENQFLSEMPPENYEAEKKTELDINSKHLHASKRKSLIFLLIAVACWYMAYGCIETNFSRYAIDILGMSEATKAIPMLVSLVAAFICFVPIANISSKIGRRKSVIISVSALFVCVFIASFVTNMAVLYGLFALVGVSWAAINVNAYPMVVEMAKGADIGKYTGYYYTFQMAAQIATPVLSGMFIDLFNRITGTHNGGMRVLFPYAAIFIVFAFVAMMFVWHGDAEKENEVVGEAPAPVMATDEIN